MAIEKDLAIKRIGFGHKPKTAKFFELADAGQVINLAILGLFARTLPEPHWRRVAAWLERQKGAFAPGRQQAEAQFVNQALDLKSKPQEAASMALAAATARSEHLMQVLKSRFSDGWRPKTEVIGMHHVESALASSRGVVLWVAPFAYSALATKFVFHDAGYRVWHFSVPGQGLSKSAFAKRYLNSISTEVEGKYLAGQVVFDPADPTRALDELRRRAESGGLVSITAGAWEGGNILEMSFLGKRLRLATNAPELAKRTAAVCLPVFTVCKQVGGPISVEIEAPLDLSGDPNTARSRAAAQFNARLSKRVTLYRDQWLGWRDLI